MSRVSDILVRVRDSLGDLDKSRWSDERLIRLISEAQDDIVVEGQMLRTKTNINIRGGVAEYELPADAYMFTRAYSTEYGKIDLISHSEMDDLGALESNKDIPINWESQTGTRILKIVYDLQNPRMLKVYPIPIDNDSIGDTFTISDYGVTVAVENDLVLNDFGVVTDISETALDTKSFSSDFGIMTDMVSVVSTLTIYYRRLPTEITDINSKPEIEAIWDKALRYYTIALALADNQDTLNIAVSDKFMGMYLRAIGKSSKVAKRNNVSSSPRGPRYNRAI